MNKRDRYKLTLLMSIFLGIVGIVILYIYFTPQIVEAFTTIEGMWSIMIVTLIKVVVVSGMAFVLMRKWFKQEQQYISDIPFAFAMFFIILGFGKFFDLLMAFNYGIDLAIFLQIMKIRYILVVLEFILLLYLSVGMLLYYLSLKDKYQKYREEAVLNSSRIRIITFITVLEIIAILLTPSYDVIVNILPVLVIPSILIIIWLFIFAYKNQRLSQVNPRILALGFSVFLITQLSRPIVQKILGTSGSFVVFSETFEIMAFSVIFIGLILKVKYK